LLIAFWRSGKDRLGLLPEEAAAIEAEISTQALSILLQRLGLSQPEARLKCLFSRKLLMLLRPSQKLVLGKAVASSLPVQSSLNPPATFVKVALLVGVSQY